MTTSPALRTRILNAVAVFLNLTSILGLVGIAAGIKMGVSAEFFGDDYFGPIGLGLVLLAIVFTANYLIFGSASFWVKLPAQNKSREDAA